ncbi:MAG: transcriptional regulator [Bacteroidetes bacterium]|nr:transcriptional regulator [Bacteroidota bacterium]
MKRILVIDDDKLFQRAIAFRLKETGYDVITADDAFQALELIDKYKIDGVVSDIMMPDISGLSLLSLLKKFYYNRIPVIIISSLGQEKAEAISLNLGAYAFIPKPIDFDDLTAQVNDMIRNAQEKVDEKQ